MDFKTNEGIVEIFKSLNCIGNENCFFATFKDTNREGMKYGAMGALVGTGSYVGGSYVASTILSAADAAMGIEGFDGFLINATEKGLGIVPMSSKGVQLMLNIEKMEPELDRFVFLPYEEIEQIIVKKFNVFNKKTQKVKIVLKGGKVLHQLAHVSEKSIPYQEANFAIFMNKYKDGAAPQVTSTSEVPVQKTEENLINNNQETEKFANLALGILMNSQVISDYNDISCEYAYLYKIEGHGYEGLFKIKKADQIYYFAVQGDSLDRIKLDEQLFEVHKQQFLDMYGNNQ